MKIVSRRRLVIVLIASIICSIVFAINSKIEVHSESDVKFRQNRFYNTDFDSINPHPSILENNEDALRTIEMSYEVEKITPTPTPIMSFSSDEIMLKIADCESHKNWGIDTGNGYFGGLQFSMGAWASVGGSGKPSDFSADEQIMRGKLLQERRGWGPWGACSKKLGLN